MARTREGGAAQSRVPHRDHTDPSEASLRSEKERSKKNYKLSAAFCGAILVGPEGGFSSQEIDYLKQKEFITPINFGPRILRSDTAVIVAMVLWHSFNGDLRDCFNIRNKIFNNS